MPHTKNRSIEILLIEDNKGDVLLTREAFRESQIPNNVNVAENGEQALDMLYKKGAFTTMATPDLILLDLNLPRITGKQVLETIKKDAQLRRIPVVILTSSKAERDVTESYDMHANSYIVKPVNMAQLTEVVKSIESFWFNISALPGRA